jgi:hypothetical protein
MTFRTASLLLLSCFLISQVSAQSLSLEGTWERIQKGTCGISGFEVQIRLDLNLSAGVITGKSYILNRRTNQYELQGDTWSGKHVKDDVYTLRHGMA